MEDQIQPTLFKKTGMAMLPIFLVGAMAVSAANSQAGRGDGMDDAIDDEVAVQRDPFWPVGYTPKWVASKKSPEQETVVGKAESTDWNKAMREIAIQGVSSRSGSEFFAVINGQIKSAGETVSVQVGDILYTWLIDSISPPSSVKLRRVSAQ